MHENLWAPWRGAYVRDLARRSADADGGDGETADFILRYWNDPAHDGQHFVVHRDAHGLVMLNRYPYANGHLLVALGDPRRRLLDYDEDARRAFWGLVEFAMDLMERTLAPQGINMGINESAAAGAGLPEHLHAHLVPRWSADTNFITVVGRVRVIPDSLEAMAEQYRAEVGRTTE